MKRLLTASEVAEYLSVDPSTVHRWARAGVLPALRIGRVVRFDPDHLPGVQTVGTPTPPEPSRPASPDRSARLGLALSARLPGVV